MLNKVQVIGNLGKDPELRFTANGRASCRFSVAANEKWKDANDQVQEHTEWFNVIAWGKLGELCGQYLKKGRQVYVEGSLRTRSYEKDGEQKFITELNAQTVKFLGEKGGATKDGGKKSSPADDEDIPF